VKNGVHFEGDYAYWRNGMRDSTWEYFDTLGRLFEKIRYTNDKPVDSTFS
jgi:hypothetical protein